METVRWGIIGVGNVCEVKSGPALQKAARSELVAVMRRNASKAQDFATRHSVPKWYADADALINDPDVNAIYIATPPHVHKDYTFKAAAAGKPVYVEKPMALNHDECQQMIGACAATRVPLFVAYYRRALPKYLKVKELLSSRAIGHTRTVTITHHRADPPAQDTDTPSWRLQPSISGGGYLLDVGSHMLDLLDFHLGPIARIASFANNHGHRYYAEDIVSGAFTFETGVQGVGSWCYGTVGAAMDRTEITGTEGCIIYDTYGNAPVVLDNADGRQEFAFEHPPHIQQPLIQTVVDALTGRGECLSTGESGARTSRVMDELIAPYYAGLDSL